LEIVCDVELGRQAAILAVAHLMAVDPEVKGRVDSLETEVDTPPTPLLR
jgi:hypothetical protein